MDQGTLRLDARARLSPPPRDVALAAAVAVFATLDVTVSTDWRGPTAVNIAVLVPLALSLAWRRQRPLGVLALVMAGLAALALAYGSSQTWTATFVVVVAIYTAVAHGSSPAAAAAIAFAGVAVYTVRDPAVDSFGDAVWGSSLAVLVVGAGLAGRTHDRRATALDRRAEQLTEEEARVAAEAAAEERRRIARELHDIVAHSLGVLVLQAGAAEQVLDRDPARAREVLASMRRTGNQALGEMGTLMGLLREDTTPSLEPQPALGDLEPLVHRAAQGGLDAEIVTEGIASPLPPAVELSAYRTVQEGLTNAMKHAPGARVRVIVRYGRDELSVEVVDDGAGLVRGEGTRRGLAGVRERVSVFGGRFEAGPRPEGGWTLRATFPIRS